MFLQIHTLTSFHASLLNRDDAGLAKRIPFGNATRLRVSSQCLKRHWRDYLCGHAELGKPGVLADLSDGYRSRNTFSRLVAPKAISLLEAAATEQTDVSAPLIPNERQTALILEAMLKGFSLRGGDEKESSGSDAAIDDQSKGGKKKEAKDDMPQPIFLGTREIDYLATTLVDAVNTQAKAFIDYHAASGALALVSSIERQKLEKKRNDAFTKCFAEHFDEKSQTIKNIKANLAQLAQSAMGKSGLTSALFGRMITSTLLANVNAPVHVAHAFSTHAANTELDFFTVVDDLNRGDETGAAHANQTEIGGAVYYGYVAVDVPLLVSNLTGLDARQWHNADLEARALVRRVLTHLVDAIAQQSPGAKLGSTAPYALADLVLLETGAGQPRALSNAFLQAVRAEGRDAHPLHASGAQLGRYLAEIDAMYGTTPAGARHLACTFEPHASLPARAPLPTAVAAALDGIFGAQPQ